MSRSIPSQYPLSKKDFIVVEEMADEVLVYDTTKNKLHVLSPVAALVWKRCDGQTPISEIAKQITVSTDQKNKEDIVWLSLTELNKTGLLQSHLQVPQDQLSRRAMIRKAAVATALTLPMITTLIAPTPAHAQSVGGGPGIGDCANPNPAGNCPPGQQKM